MTTERAAKASAEPKYRSGAVARLTGIPVDTLRMWERRYGVVGPRQSESGHRLYSPEDVERLVLIKRLVDLGSTIGTLAPLSTVQLKDMLETARAAGRAAQPGAERAPGVPIRVAIVGEALAQRVRREIRRLPQIELAGTAESAAELPQALIGATVDVLAMEFSQLQAEDAPRVDALARSVGARRAIVVYGFAREATVNALRERGHLAGRAPIALADFEALCRAAARAGGEAAVPHPPLEAPPPRRFDARDLAEIASLPATMFCECPRHIAELLVQLGNFEAYSAECVNRSAEDAALHAYLLRVSGTARAMFEEALARVAQAEGIALPSAPAAAGGAG